VLVHDVDGFGGSGIRRNADHFARHDLADGERTRRIGGWLTGAQPLFERTGIAIQRKHGNTDRAATLTCGGGLQRSFEKGDQNEGFFINRRRFEQFDGFAVEAATHSKHSTVSFRCAIAC